jgi:hypothetical protein
MATAPLAYRKHRDLVEEKLFSSQPCAFLMGYRALSSLSALIDQLLPDHHKVLRPPFFQRSVNFPSPLIAMRMIHFLLQTRSRQRISQAYLDAHDLQWKRWGME